MQNFILVEVPLRQNADAIIYQLYSKQNCRARNSTIMLYTVTIYGRAITCNRDPSRVAHSSAVDGITFKVITPYQSIKVTHSILEEGTKECTLTSSSNNALWLADQAGSGSKHCVVALPKSHNLILPSTPSRRFSI
jgi:hypothetical protein